MKSTLKRIAVEFEAALDSPYSTSLLMLVLMLGAVLGDQHAVGVINVVAVLYAVSLLDRIERRMRK